MERRHVTYIARGVEETPRVVFNLRRSTRDVTHTDTHSKHSEYTTHASIAGRNAAVTAAAVNPAMGSVSTHVSTMRPKRPLYKRQNTKSVESP